MNFESGIAKFGDSIQEFMLFHFMYKKKVVFQVLSKLVLKLDNFVGQVMAIGGMKMRLLVKHTEQQGR